ncbi:MAG: two pore domain potassium channel family protein [Ardenticatenales bacterium]|nr:two pore domain potassium channel family protein [Ardenticatenales bacterium]
MARNPELRILLVVVLATLASGMFFYRRFEGWSLLDSLYFSVITLTTVGYGDFAPQTNAGKIFTIFYIIVGLGILAAFITTVANIAIEQDKARAARRNQSADKTQDPPTTD